jgi:hypothetical protein
MNSNGRVFSKQVLKNSKGLLTVDFMFGIIITFVIMLTLFRVCYSLLVVEVAQYIAYSTARAHAAADIDLPSQREAGMKKYKELKNNPVWQHLFKDAFELNKDNDLSLLKSGEAAGGSYTEYMYNDRDGSELNGIPFIGAVLKIKLSWLNMNVPFLGRTADADEDFKTKITSLLLREPSARECRDFMESRYDEILKLDTTRFSPANSTKHAYVPMEDNGC